MGSLMNIQCVSLLCIFLLNMSACEDLKPPSVPDAIAVPSGRKAVRSFSGKGTIKYSFDGSQWQVDQMRGELDNIGSFYSNGKPDSHRSDFYLQTRNPNVGHYGKAKTSDKIVAMKNLLTRRTWLT